MSEMMREETRIRGALWDASVARQAGKLVLYMLLLGLISLMVAPLLMIDTPVVRVPLNLLLFAGVVLLAYNDGGVRGQKEVASGLTLARRQAGGLALTQEELRACYRPARGLLAAALAALPFFVAALMLAVLARPYAYVLQTLPTWLGAYVRREDIGGALQFYSQTQGAEFADYLRVGVRLVVMPASYMITGFGDQASLLLDRISPLLVLLIPGGYAAGYLRGPSLHALAAKRSEEAKRQHKKKVARKKKRERQARERKGPERLI